MKDQNPNNPNDQARSRRSLFADLRYDYSRYSMRPGNLNGYISKFFAHPGFRAIVLYRFGHWFRQKKRYHLAALMERIIFHSCYSEISSAAEIAPGFLISHTIGLVIGSETRIGWNCDVRQNVTFGGNFNKVDENGLDKPWLEDNVSVGAGAVIIGPVKIGTNTIIGANSVVTKDVPQNMIVSGIPAKVIKERWSVGAKRNL